jgi:hypothetical protein
MLRAHPVAVIASDARQGPCAGRCSSAGDCSTSRQSQSGPGAGRPGHLATRRLPDRRDGTIPPQACGGDRPPPVDVAPSLRPPDHGGSVQALHAAGGRRRGLRSAPTVCTPRRRWPPSPGQGPVATRNGGAGFVNQRFGPGKIILFDHAFSDALVVDRCELAVYDVCRKPSLLFRYDRDRDRHERKRGRERLLLPIR